MHGPLSLISVKDFFECNDVSLSVTNIRGQNPATLRALFKSSVASSYPILIGDVSHDMTNLVVVQITENSQQYSLPSTYLYFLSARTTHLLA